MANSAQQPFESKYARKKREEVEGKRQPFTFVPSKPALQAASALEPVRSDASARSKKHSFVPLVGRRTWQLGSVIDFDGAAAFIAGYVDVKGDKYPFTMACAKVAQLNADTLKSGYPIMVRLKLCDDMLVVQSLKQP